jgi:hypothetical protein
VLAGGVLLDEVGLLTGGECRLLAAELALGTGDGHALASLHPQQIDLELGEGGQDVEEHLGHRVGRAVDRAVEGELHVADGEGVADAWFLGVVATPLGFRW